MSTPTSRWLAQLAEPELRLVVQSLLEKIGYKRVTITHGSQEFGRDLVFVEEDPIGRRVWRGAQVKAKPISGSLEGAGLRMLANQCEAAIDVPFTTTEGEQIELREVWLISSHALSESAKHSLQGPARLSRRLHIIDGPLLADLVHQHLPTLANAGLHAIDDYLRRLQEFCDAPGEYFSTRLHVAFRLSDTFVMPDISCRLLKPSSVAEAARIVVAVRLDDLRQDIEQALILRRARLHPAQAETDNHLAFDHLDKLANDFAIVDLDATLIAALKGTVGAQRLDPLGDLSANVTTEVLESCEDALRALKLDEVRFLKPLPPHASAEDRRTWAAARREFYERLLDVYGNGTREYPETLMIGAIARALVTRVPRPDAELERQLEQARERLDEIERIINQLDDEIRERYAASWFKGVDPEAREVCVEDIRADLSNLSWLWKATTFFGRYWTHVDDQGTKVTGSPLIIRDSLPRLLITADLGMGKSTLLKRLADVRARQYPATNAVPWLCNLGLLKGGYPPGDVATAIRGTAFDKGIDVADDLAVTREYLLDGFDEISSLASREQVRDWIARHDRAASIVLSSRPAALWEPLSYLPRFDIVPLTLEQRFELLRRLPWPDGTSAEPLIAYLRTHDDIQELSRTPLLLVMIALVSQRIGVEGLPRRREALYRQILTLFLSDWDRSKRVHRPHRIDDEDLRLTVLASLACSLYESRRRAFTRERFEGLALTNLPTELATPEAGAELFDEFLMDSLIVPVSGTEYAFFHFSMQEYLAAWSLTKDHGLKRVWSAVEDYFLTGWWEEVLVFYAGSKRDATPLFDDLHMHLTEETSDRETRLRRLVERWLEVGDLTRLVSINAKGPVANAIRAARAAATSAPKR